MPNPKNIAILGAGVMGLTAACVLSRRGHALTIYDPAGFPPQKSASAIAGGMLAPYAEIEHMSGPWIEAGMRGITFWAEFAKHHDIDFGQNGSFMVAHPNDRYILDRFKSMLPANTGAEKESAEIEPALAQGFKSGLFIPAEAHLHPAKAMDALCAELKNATMRIESKAHETLSGQFDRVIDARGLGMNAPSLRGVKGEIIVVHNPEFSLTRPVRLMHPRYPLYIVPRRGNIFMIGATQIETENGERVTLRSAMELLSALYTLHPSFGEAHILETPSGLRPSYPDNLPRVTQNGNVISAGGMFRHGWLLAPAMSEAVADLIDNRENPFISLFYPCHPERSAAAFQDSQRKNIA